MSDKAGRKPEWLKKTWRPSDEIQGVENLVRDLGLNTVCREASCPNYSECFGRGVATFMILGAICTRNCGFCGVASAGTPDSDATTTVGSPDFNASADGSGPRSAPDFDAGAADGGSAHATSDGNGVCSLSETSAWSSSEASKNFGGRKIQDIPRSGRKSQNLHLKVYERNVQNSVRSEQRCGARCHPALHQNQNRRLPVDADEPARVAEAVNRLGLAYVVVTSVTRDDLPDGGAAHFAQTIREIRRLSPATKIEVLIPDFGGDKPALGLVIAAGPDVISHNMETVRALYEKVRPQADYDRSLEVLRRIASAADPGAESVAGCTESLAPGAESPAPGEASPKCKSGFMAGVGETDAQVLELMDDLRAAGCTILTIGQYLRPSPDNIPVEAYIAPEVFDRWAAAARERGFEFVASAPFVRSSYHAEEALE